MERNKLNSVKDAQKIVAVVIAAPEEKQKLNIKAGASEVEIEVDSDEDGLIGVEFVKCETREQIERKIRILNSYIIADKNKRDAPALKRHKKSLAELEQKLKEMKE